MPSPLWCVNPLATALGNFLLLSYYCYTKQTPHRIDYYGDLSRMIIRIPTEQHEILAFESSMFIRQLLYDQGFCWPNWPGGMHYIEQTGAADRKIPRAGRPGSGFQPDASLKIKGMEFPFLVVEVADSQEYAEARLKAHSFLLDTQGQVRFVIIVDLVRKTWKQKREARLAAERDVPGAGYEPSESENQDPGTGENLESLPSRSKGETSGLGEDRDSEAAAASDPADTSGSNPQHMPSNKRPGDHSSPHPTAKKLRAAPGPAASTRSPAAGLTPTTPPAASSPSDEGSPTLPPPHTHEGYTHATVTVLTSHRAPRANRRKGNSKGKREVITLIRPTEFWPTPPPADLKFSFTWDDMEIADYPPELKDSIYTIRFDWLHTALKVYFSVPGEGQVPQPLLDGSSAVGRSDEEEEEVEEEPSSGRVESDESYRP